MLPYEIDHAYGDNIHVLDDVFLQTYLAELCSESTTQPRISTLVQQLYSHLVKTMLNAEFPKEHAKIRTRMAKISPYGIWSGQILARSVPTVTVNIVRAGSVPSQVCYDTLNQILDPSLVRQDHVVMSRITDDNDRVTGSHFGDSKIGGGIDNAFVLFPDPMGATGNSVSQAIHHYKNTVSGNARRYIALHLIITPEYVKHMRVQHPDLVVYALRLDRGASAPDILLQKPGTKIEQESGLTDKQYIVPGGGGFGEIMNNSYC